jgi:hypothetical protein
LFREVNERLEHRAAGDPTTGDRFEILCECAREECTERITIAFAEYEQTRDDAKKFIVLAGHIDPSCERILTRQTNYMVVEKFGDAAAVAEIENPRDGNNAHDEPER